MAKPSVYFDIFEHNLNHVQKIKNANPNDSYLLKLLYANVITLMEEYFSTLFIDSIIGNKQLTNKLLQNEKYKQMKIGFPVIFKKTSDDILESKLKSELYHNIKYIQSIYKNVLEIDLSYPGWLRKAIQTRHDIIHRNGVDLLGKEIKLDKNMLDDLASDMKVYLEEIDKNFITKNN